ncbi:MAG: hypothetical protein IID54_01190 [Proteobacteria bacterium]|nr:hypothetical protein [Pseudomonadota bacterium]
MNGLRRSACRWATGLFLAWLTAFLGSFVLFLIAEPVDFGFTMPWFWLQAIAVVIAITAWASVRRRRSHLTRTAIFLGRLPLLVTVGEILLLIGIVLSAT